MVADTKPSWLFSALILLLVCGLAACAPLPTPAAKSPKAPQPKPTPLKAAFQVELGVPYLRLTPEPGFRLMRNTVTDTTALVVLRRSDGGADLKIEARKLRRPMDSPELQQALVRVSQKQLRARGAIDFGTVAAGDIGGIPARWFGYSLAGKPSIRYLATTPDWLYTVDMSPCQGHAGEQLKAMARQMRLSPEADAAPSMAQTPASPPPIDIRVRAAQSRAAETIKLADNFDPPSLTQALSGLEPLEQFATAGPGQAALAAQTKALWVLSLKAHGRKVAAPMPEALMRAAEAATRDEAPGAAAWRAYGLALLSADRPVDAEAALEKAKGLAPRDPQTLWALALWSDFRPKTQEKWAREALREQSDFIGARITLARSLARQGKPRPAADELNLVLSLRPRNTSALLELARLEMESPDSQAKARQHLEALVAVDPRDPTALYNLALVLLRLGQTDQAIATLGELIRINPNDAGARKLLGLALMSQKNFAKAAESFQACVRCAQPIAACYAYLGEIQALELNQREAAAQSLRRYLELEGSGRMADRSRSLLRSLGGQ